jgi:hypothetical protein
MIDSERFQQVAWRQSDPRNLWTLQHRFTFGLGIRTLCGVPINWARVRNHVNTRPCKRCERIAERQST